MGDNTARIEVFDFDFHRLGIIEHYTTLQYTEKYNSVGSFTLTCWLEDDNVRLLRNDRILWLEKDIAGIIQYIGPSSDDKSDKLVVKGKLLPEILNWRWIYPCYTTKATPPTIMEQLVESQCVYPSSSARTFPGLSCEHNSYSDFESITYQKTGGSVLEAIEALGQAHELGYTVAFNPRLDEPLKFRVLRGVDRSLSNGERQAVYFSHALNNIVSGQYTADTEKYRNVLLVAGEAVNKEDREMTSDDEEKENVSRKTLEYGEPSTTAYQRRELFIDARDIQSEYNEDEPTGEVDDEGNSITQSVTKELSEDEYLDLLKQRGQEKIADNAKLESYTGKIRTDAQTLFHYGVDYHLGDIVTVVDSRLDIRIDRRVTEMQVTIDAKGKTYEPTFGEGLPTLMEKVRKALR